MTLFGDFLDENHRRTHKWYQYFPAYERHLARFRNRHLTLFEIGVGEGGSLQMWRRYLGPFAIIVGLDIYPRARQLEEHQIHIRNGNQGDAEFLEGVVHEFGSPDIVIDDGSHLQPDVKRSFDLLYPLVAKNGVYIVEDLHAAYWPNCGGGLNRPGSLIEIAKTYIDKIHADFAGDPSIRTAAGDRTTSVHFYNSLAVFEVGEHRVMGNKTTGNPALYDNAWIPRGEEPDSFCKHCEEVVARAEKPGPWQEPGPTVS